MSKTAKVFTTGRSQAVRLPLEYRSEGTEVFIRRDPESGDVVLSAKPLSWSAHAVALDAVLVTSDQAFARVPKDRLKVTDWTATECP